MDDFQQRATEIRNRLLRPPNAVPDPGIDLKRIPKGFSLMQKKPAVMIEYQPPANKVVNTPHILRIVAEAFGLGVKDILGPSRRLKCSTARHISIHLIYKYIPSMSSVTIGRKIGRDHSSVLHGKRKIERLVAKDEHMAAFIREIEARILA